MATKLDRASATGVGAGMHRFARLMTALALGAALVACGGKDKKAPAAPGTTEPGQAGMNDGDPSGDPGSPDQAGGQPGQPGAEPGAGGEQAGTDPATGEPEAPPIVAPNLDPDPAQAKSQVDEHLKRGNAALQASSLDPDKAIAEAKAALAIDATSVDAVVVMAHGYYHKKLYDTAEVILDMLFKERAKAKDNAGVYFVYGLVYDKINEPQKARVAYEKAVELEPNHLSALTNLGIHQLANKQYREAVRTYEKVSRERPSAPVWNALGSAYRGQSADYDPGAADRANLLRKADTAFKRAIQADRNFGQAYYNLGLLYLDADPYPGEGGAPMDTLLRLQQAKKYFDDYKNMPGASATLHAERTKDVDKLIKREEKARKKNAKEKAAPEG
jgi:tetratricopeptide (TPR) repeat protein